MSGQRRRVRGRLRRLSAADRDRKLARNVKRGRIAPMTGKRGMAAASQVPRQRRTTTEAKRAGKLARRNARLALWSLIMKGRRR